MKSGLRHQALTPVGHQSAPLPGTWTTGGVTISFAGALTLPLAISVYQTAGTIVPLLAAAIITAMAWTLLFARWRQQHLEWHCIITAIIFALMVPPTIPLWQALLALSFGIVVGEQIFGGRGFGFLSAQVTALAFVLFSFPGSTDIPESPLIAISVIPGALVLVTTRLISWRILVSFLIGLFGATALVSLTAPLEMALTSSLVLGLVFLVCDPVSAASTNTGRWAFGLLAGVLAVLLAGSGEGAGTLAAIVFAALLASIFAPLIDRIVIIVNINRRRRRNG